MDKIMMLIVCFFTAAMPKNEFNRPLSPPALSAKVDCGITNIFFENPGICDDNGTPSEFDDFFTMDVVVEYTEAPSTGTMFIDLGEDAITGGGPVSVNVNQLVLPDGTFTFEQVRFKANNDATEVRVGFSIIPGCTLRIDDGPAVPPCSTSQPCSIDLVSLSNASACQNSGTGNANDDFFTMDVTVTFSNPPTTGDLRFEPGGDALPGGGATSVPVVSLVGNSHTFNGVRFKANGTPTVVEVEFSANNTGCVRTQVGPTVSSCSAGLACNITGVSITNAGACTGDPGGDFFTADVIVNFNNAPATGDLRIEPGGDALPGGGATSVPVANLVGNSHTFSGVRFKADGTPTVVEVEFSDDQSCVRTQVGPTVNACCNVSITSVTAVPGACNNNSGSISIVAAGAATLNYAITGPVSQSNTTGIFTGLPGGAYTVAVTDAATNCTANATTNIGPAVDNIPPVPNCRSASVELDISGNHTFSAAEVLNLGASSDNCGTVNFVGASPTSVSCAQSGQVVPVLVTVNDGNGNTATCTANMSIISGQVLPAGLSAANIGAANGSSSFNSCLSSNIAITAQGFSSPGSDVIHLASKQLCGNGEIIARVVSVGGGGWGGITMRESTAQGAKKVELKTQLSNHITRTIRSTANGPASSANLLRPQESWLKLVRAGNNFSGYSSVDGINWNFAFSASISMANCIRVGLFAESINVNTTTSAVFNQLTINGAPAPAMTSEGNTVENSFSTLDFQVFPNPSSGWVTLDVSNYQGRSLQIEVSNTQGELLKTFNIISNNKQTLEQIDLSSFASGVYFIRIRTDYQLDAVKRVVLQKL